MSTFTVTPGAAYNVGVTQPQVAGTPTPAISYAWTFGGEPIGNTRVVQYTFAEATLPGTLQCVVTLSNIAGSVSRTLTATVQAASNLPVLNAVTIRDNASPTVTIASVEIDSGDSHIGRVLRVGGPAQADLNPTGSNFTSIAYQWRRDGSAIAGATSQTHTIVEADEDTTLSVTATAQNLSGSVTRTASVVVGESSVRPPLGDHLPLTQNNVSGPMFVNLIYSGINSVRFGGQALIRNSGGSNNPQNARLGRDVAAEEWGDRGEYFTVDGWPYRQSTGAITDAMPVRIELALTSPFRWLEMLSLPGSEILDADEYAIENGKLRAKLPAEVRNRTFTFDLRCYWEGSGRAVGGRVGIGTAPETSQVSFTGPSGDGPYGDGTRTMSMSVTGLSVEFDDVGLPTQTYLTAFITESDATGDNPLRNLIAMVANVRDAVTGELIYAGFDHTNYAPFQMYPRAIERYRKVSHIRSLQNEHARSTYESLRLSSMVHEKVGDLVQTLEYWDLDQETQPLIRTVWTPVKDPSGYEKGFGAINRPTHACFGNSMRAMVEVCRQCGCGLWWCHPAATIKVATVIDGEEVHALDVGSSIGNASQTGTLAVWEDYAAGFASEIERMPPGVEVFSEYANENWNTAANYQFQNITCFNVAQRAIAGENYGGDGDVFVRRVGAKYAIGASGLFAETETGDAQKEPNATILATGILAGCVIAQRIRELTSRSIVCVGGMWSNGRAFNAKAIGMLFARAPLMMKELDALAEAPYRDPIWWDQIANIRANRWMRDQSLVAFGSGDAVWASLDGPVDHIERKFGETRPYTSDDSLWKYRRDHFTAFKSLALDRAYSGGFSYERQYVPSGWSGRRRWNLRALCYEGGSHWLPGERPSEYVAGSRQISAALSVHPLYETFQRRYMETLFSPGPRGLVRDAADALEAQLFKAGQVPAGVEENAEPLSGAFTHIRGIDDPTWAGGSSWWGMGWWFGHDSPQLRGNDYAVARGIGLPNWWVNYEFGD